MHYDQVSLQPVSIWTKNSEHASVIRPRRSFDDLDTKDMIAIHNAKWVNDQLSENTTIVKPHKVVIERAQAEVASDDIDIEVW